MDHGSCEGRHRGERETVAEFIPRIFAGPESSRWETSDDDRAWFHLGKPGVGLVGRDSAGKWGVERKGCLGWRRRRWSWRRVMSLRICKRILRWNWHWEMVWRSEVTDHDWLSVYLLLFTELGWFFGEPGRITMYILHLLSRKPNNGDANSRIIVTRQISAKIVGSKTSLAGAAVVCLRRVHHIVYKSRWRPICHGYVSYIDSISHAEGAHLMACKSVLALVIPARFSRLYDVRHTLSLLFRLSILPVISHVSAVVRSPSW